MKIRASPIGDLKTGYKTAPVFKRLMPKSNIRSLSLVGKDGDVCEGCDVHEADAP